MKFGITQGTAGKSGEEFPKRAKELGFEGMEPMMGTHVSETDLGRPAVRRRLFETAKKIGIAIPSAAFALFNETGGFVKDAPDSDEELFEAIRCASFVSAKVLLVCSYFNGDPKTPQEIEKFMDGIRRALPEAKNVGLKLALEVPLDAETLVRLVDQEGSEFLGVYYDLGNTLWLGRDPAAEIRRLGKRILALHLKDTAEMLGDRHLGEGRGNWQDIAAAIDDIDYKGWFMLETPREDDAAIRRDLEFMKNMIR